MLKSVLLAIAMTAATSASAAYGIQPSNIQLSWEDVDNTGNLTTLSGEYVAENSFYVGGKVADGDDTLFGEGATLVNVNAGAYFPIERTAKGEFYGKVGLGYTDVSSDVYDYEIVSGQLAGFWEGDKARVGAGIVVETADLYGGFGLTSYSLVTQAAWKITPAWELGVTGTFGDLDAYGFNLRYNFL